MSKLLIDGDVLVYRAGFATEKTAYAVTEHRKVVAEVDNHKDAKAMVAGERVLWSRKLAEPEDKAVMILDVMMGDIKARYPDLTPVVTLSGVGNFRYSVATRKTYKGNRDTPKPTHAKALFEHLVSKGAIVSAKEEADDVIGILATSNPGSVIATVDKDLMQIPGRHYNFVTKEEVTVSVKEAAVNFYAQVLSGDSVDNVPGIPGIGPVKARKALEDCSSPAQCWQRCLDLYQGEFGAPGAAYALEAARLVYVRKKVNETWEPPVVQTKTTKTQRVA